MATSKTLTPTNVTIQIPAMTDAPDQSVNSNCIDKLGDAVNTLNSKLTPIYKKTITGTTSTTGAIDSQLNVSNYYIISATLSTGGGLAGFVFWRGNDGYLKCFDIDMQTITNTSVSIDIVYCKKSELKTE